MNLFRFVSFHSSGPDRPTEPTPSCFHAEKKNNNSNMWRYKLHFSIWLLTYRQPLFSKHKKKMNCFLCCFFFPLPFFSICLGSFGTHTLKTCSTIGSSREMKVCFSKMEKRTKHSRVPMSIASKLAFCFKAVSPAVSVTCHKRVSRGRPLVPMTRPPI